MPDSTPLPSSCPHDWEEVYYGTKCRLCGLFYPDGCAPWDVDLEDGYHDSAGPVAHNYDANDGTEVSGD